MTTEQIKKFMKESKITYEMLSKMANIPLTTLKSIFCGTTKNPRIDTMDAIETALGLKEKATDSTVAEIITALKGIGITEEKFKNLTEEQRADFLQLVKIYFKNKK